MAVSQDFDELVRERYRLAVSVNGDLGVDPQAFGEHLRCIADRCCGSRDAGPGLLVEFARSLHSNDLLLTLACSRGSDAAWRRFSTLYRKYLADVSRRLTRRNSDPQEFGDIVWVDLFLPDRSGQSRIASYDGRSSLATWLRVVVSNRIINEHLRKGARFSNLDRIPEPADPAALHNVESRLGRSRYGSMILKCFEHASSLLKPQERLILLLRYDQGLSLGEIARLYSVHQSTITRQIERIARQLRDSMISLLASQYGLDQEATEECLAVASETISTSISILDFLRSLVSGSCRRPEETCGITRTSAAGL
jgi:RNA polymerase sigma-70 factor (ECF subfamily)